MALQSSLFTSAIPPIPLEDEQEVLPVMEDNDQHTRSNKQQL